MSLDDLSATVEQLYAAAAGPASWSDALRAVEDPTGATGAVCGFVPPIGAEWRAAIEALEQLPHGAAVIDDSRRILFLNRAAEAILVSQDGLLSAGQRLSAMRSSSARAMERLLGEAATSSGSQGGWLRVPRPSGRRDYLLFAAPLTADSDLAGVGQPRALVAIFDPEARRAIDTRAVQAIFDLTAKEAQIAAMLADGRDLAMIADRLNIARDTVRTHLKNIFRKLEVNRQQDVANLLLALPAMHMGAAG